MPRRKSASDPQQPLFSEEGPVAAAAPPSAACRRHWLDPRCGILASAADWLLDAARSTEGPPPPGSEPPTPGAALVDLSAFTVVVPGRAAGHRLVEILIDKRAASGPRSGDATPHEGSLIPPKIVTLGTLPEELYEPAKPLADTTTETLCWVVALAAASRRDRQLIAPLPDADEDQEADTASGRRKGSDAAAEPGPRDSVAAGAFEAARMLVSMHRELAANGLSFADLSTAADKVLPGFGDHARWQALARLEQVYLAEIDALGFWDRQTARRVAIERGEVDFDGRIVLLATVDVDPLQRKLLAGVRGKVDALVPLPPDIGPDPERCFDDFGGLLPEAWVDRPLPVALERLMIVDDDDGQADAVVEWIRGLAATRSADDITIAVPDPAIVPAIEQRLTAAGLAGRYAAGRTVERSSPWQLVRAIFAWLRRREFAPLADLLRCPDCIDLVRRRTGASTPSAIADDVALRHLPLEVDREHLAAAASHPAERAANETFVGILDCIDDWLAPLRAAIDAIDAARHSPRRPTSKDREARPRRGAAAPPAGKATLGATWVQALRGVITAAVDGIDIDRDDPSTRVFARSLAALGEQLADLETIPDRLVAAAGSAGIERLLLSTWGRSQLPPSHDPAAIELVGWLEVALDDAPALAITSCVEGCLPGSAGRDPLLPEPLRQALGLDNTLRTAARDAWMLAVAATREDLVVIIPRRVSDGSPAVPSRLLFRRPPEDVVRAAQRLFDEPRPRVSVGPPAVVPSRLPVPMPSMVSTRTDVDPPMRVTEFRDYLACPYRYWLRHRLGLGTAGDDALELAAGDFGTLIHECLDRFAKDARLATSTDGEEIATGLSEILDRLVAQRYGRGASPAVFVQAELARRRLREFARVQADRTAAGWVIHATEQIVRSSAFVVDGVPVKLSGKIDRIDRHPDDDRWEILDYKTSARGKSPERTHRDSRGWIDLQLPLYRHLLVEVEGIPDLDLGNPERVGVGYFNIPAHAEEVQIVTASWSNVEYESADDAARDVVRAVRQGRFWPPNDAAAGAFPEFDAICQTHAIRDEDEEGEPA